MQSTVSTCYKRKRSETTSFLGMYVDDGMMVGRPRLVIEYVIQLKGDIDIVDPEYLRKLLGVNYTRVSLRNARGMLLDQNDYCRYLTQVFEEDNRGPPREADTPWIEAPKDLEIVFPGKVRDNARKHIGGLLFLSCHARPDTISATCFSAREVESWSEASDMRLRRIFGYLRANPTLGILWVVNEYDVPSLFGNRTRSDSDHGGDLETARSTSGWCGYFATMNWSSKILIEHGCQRQTATSPSSTEAETGAANDCVIKSGYWMLAFLEEVLDTGSEPFWTHEMDNDASRIFLSGQKLSKINYIQKHQRINLGFLRDTFDKREHPGRSLDRADTKANESDIFTKGLQKDSFLRHRDTLGMVNTVDYIAYVEELPPLPFLEQKTNSTLRDGATTVAGLAMQILRPVGSVAVAAIKREDVRQFVLGKVFRRG